MTFPFVKGHGTRNDFVVLPDLDGSVHGDLDDDVVTAICDRRTGIGADGVLRVMRTDPEGPWFMDYRNADGSVSETCGNGIRVFARYLAETGLVDPAKPLTVNTRAGLKQVTFCDDGEISVDMGVPSVLGTGVVSVSGLVLDAVSVHVGNPHAVAVVDSLDQAGDLRDSPFFCGVEFPDGVNIEFAERRGNGRFAIRVFERGVGETFSCGSGACAVAAVIAAGDGQAHPTSYTIEVAGGVLSVSIDADGHAHLKGPAVLVAEGTWTG